MKPKSTQRRSQSSRIVAPLSDTDATPEAHYRREKARRATVKDPAEEAMEAAKREYLAHLAATVIKGKGGRPRKKVARPAADTQTEIDLDLTDDE